MRLFPSGAPRRAMFAGAFNWGIWGLCFTVVGSQFLGIVWDSSSNYVRSTFGRSPLEPMMPIDGFNDEAYADRAYVCIQEANAYVPKQLSKVLQDPMLAQMTATGPSKNGFRVVKRETMTLSPLSYDAYARVCDRVAFTLTAIQDSCVALGYNVTRAGLQIVDDIASNATTRDLPRALPVLVVPFWDNAVHSYYAIPSWDGAACVFRLNGIYQSATLTFGVLRATPRSIRTTKTEAWLRKPGGEWRNGWYEDPQGTPWLPNMITSKNGGPLGLEVRQFDTLANKEIDCDAPATASRCKPALIIEKWGSQFTTTTEIVQQDQVFVSNGKRVGFFLFDALSKRTTSNAYSLETFISNVSIFALLFRWFVSMATMHNSYRKGATSWQTTGIGCLSSSRAFNVLPIVLLPRLKMTLTVLSSAGCNFQGQQSALGDAWYVMYPGIVELLFYYYSLLNVVGKITYRRLSDALFGPTLLCLCGLHFFRAEIADMALLGLGGRIPTLLMSDQVDALKLVDFFTTDVALRLNGNAIVVFFTKLALLALSLLPLFYGEKMTVNGRKSKAFEACEIETALALRAGNVGGLGRSPIYAPVDHLRRALGGEDESVSKIPVTTLKGAPSIGHIFQSRSTVGPIKGASKLDEVQPMKPSSGDTRHVLVSYELNRLGYLVYGDKFLITYDDRYVLTSTSPLRMIERLWNYRITVFDVAKSDDGLYFTISQRPRMCRVDDPELRAISFYEVTISAFQ